MKKILILLALIPASAFSQSIKLTRHDFTNAANAVFNSDNSESKGQLCIYCHTPHKAAATKLLWNRTLSSQVMTWNADEKTTQGTSLPTGTSANLGSRRCLSCHDTSIGINASLNNKGAGQAGTLAWTGLTQPTADYRVGVTGDMNGNHPISVPFPRDVGGATNALSGVSEAALAGGYWAAKYDVACQGAQGICTTEPSNGNRINLNQVGISTTEGSVECSSCHEPHNKYGGEASYFLRVSLSQSALCFSCHNK